MIITASVGGGHNSAARAISEGLRIAHPALDVELIDVMDLVPRLFRAYYSGGFALAMTRFPQLYGIGFRLTDRPHRPQRSRIERMRLWRERKNLKRLVDMLPRHRADLIVHTHFLAPPLVAYLRRCGSLSSPQMVVLTDIEAHRFWYSEEVARWFVADESSVETLKRWGIDDGCITVSGIPIHPKWTGPLKRADILREWRLPNDKQIVLLSGGTEFTCGPIAKIASSLAARCPDACVVVLGGRNKKLLATLASMPAAAEGKIIPQGFTDRLNELVEVCSVMVTKAGGITTAECAAKGAPMVLLQPVPGQEADNAAYYARQGAAVITNNPRQAVQEVSALLADTERLGRMAASARRLHKPATETIVNAIASALQAPHS